jgi:iron complex outermembrane receptor protein
MRLPVVLLLLLPFPAFSQAPPVPTLTESISVTSAVEPFPLADNNRSVTLLDVPPQQLGFNSVADLLRLDPSLNLQARAGNGVQSDLSLRGTTFEQTLVLLNGFRINDPESGHLNLDLPLPLEAIARIDVVHGSGSTFYGSDAIGGAINLVTARPAHTALFTRAGFGNFGSEEQHLLADLVTRNFADRLSGARDTSNGFLPDRGYHANTLANEGWLDSPAGLTDILLAASDRPYGADQFYGAYDSWERTKAWFASIQQAFNPRTAASFGYQRHTDLFVLYNKRPQIYENNHITTSWQAALRRAANPDGAHRLLNLSYGVEADGDSIASSNLGEHARKQGAAYASLALRPSPRLSFTAGAREEVFNSGSVFSPSLAAAFQLVPTLRLRAAAGHGFRLPTYTDLYYADPASIGNPNLKAESSWSYEAGLDTSLGRRTALAVTAFRLQQKDTIDYSKYHLTDPWQANNVSHLDLTGVESTVRVELTRTQQLTLGYTAVHSAPPPTGLISEYAFNFAAQNALLSWSGQFFHQFSASTQVNVVQRTGHTAYPLWNLSLARSTGRVQPYVRLMNLSNTGYQEIPNVPMQGRSVMAGVAYSWTRNP